MGRGNDDTIGPEDGGELVIETHAKITHTRDGAFGDDDIVERFVLGEEIALAPQLTVQHGAGIGLEAILAPAFERGVEIGQRNFGQEAEGAEVDAQDRCLGFCEDPRGGKQRAIASQHDHQVRLRGRHLVPRKDAPMVRIVRTDRVENRVEPVGLHPEQQLGEESGELFLLRFGDDCYIAHEVSVY